MANRTQIRQQQLTGSTVDIKARLNNAAAINNAQPGLAAALTGSDQLDLFGYVGAALHRIHGAASTEPFNNAVSTLSDGASPRITYINGAGTIIKSEDGSATALTVGSTGNNVDIVAAGGLTVTTNLAVNGNATLGDGAGDEHTINGLAAFINDVEIQGNLKVVGDTTTTYITSSVVEFQDPMMITNAADMSKTNNEAKGRNSLATFLSASSDIETFGGANKYDYGVLSKRALGFSPAAVGAGNADQITVEAGQIKSLISDSATEFAKAGSPFGIFKTEGFAGGTLAGADTGDRTFTLQPGIKGATVRPAEMLNAMRGAYVLLSSSNGVAKKRFGIIKSATYTAGINNVVVNVLGSNHRYDNVQLNTDQLATADFATASNGTNVGSIHLLSSYAGTIFDKEQYEFHHAAAAITGSGDNVFHSGSANVLLYGGTNSAKMTLHANNLVSGSSVLAELDYYQDPRNASTVRSARLQSALDTDLIVRGQRALILSGGAQGVGFVGTGTGDLVKFPADDGSANQVMATNGTGQLSFVDVSGIVASKAAQASLTVGATIPAGSNNLNLKSGGNLGNVHVNLEDDIRQSSNFTNASAAGLQERLDVYVNGQLLVSASKPATNMPPTDGDYFICSLTGSSTAVSASFAFDLEADDIITLKLRG